MEVENSALGSCSQRRKPLLSLIGLQTNVAFSMGVGRVTEPHSAWDAVRLCVFFSS